MRDIHVYIISPLHTSKGVDYYFSVQIAASLVSVIKAGLYINSNMNTQKLMKQGPEASPCCYFIAMRVFLTSLIE